MEKKQKYQPLRDFIKKTILNENQDTLQTAETPVSMDGKYATKRAIINAVYNVLKKAGVEGRYTDEYWLGPKKLTNALSNAGIDFSLQKSNYAGHNSLYSTSSLPNRKEYKYFLKIKDRSGKEIHLPLKVTCAFVGNTGTMEDDTYELTYVIEV